MRNGSSKPERKEKASTPAPPPKISIKGKEREVVSPVPVAAKSKKSSPVQADATPLNEKKCKDVLKHLTKLREAAIFLQPVDVVRDGCPT